MSQFVPSHSGRPRIDWSVTWLILLSFFLSWMAVIGIIDTARALFK